MSRGNVPSRPPSVTPSPAAEFDVRDLELTKPTVFRASVNRFEHLNLSQAWSLWLTGGRDDGLFGIRPSMGWLLTGVMLAIVMLIALEKLSTGII